MYLQTQLIIKKLTTSSYKKPTKISPYLTTTDKCLQKYKIVIIKNLIHREFYVYLS